MAKRGSRTTLWKPGQSGNPGGRKKSDPRLIEACRSHTPEAVAVLISIMRNKKATPGVRLCAVREIFDRAWGRPMQQVMDVTPRTEDGLLDPVESARRIAFAIGLADQAIEKAQQEA